MVLIAIPIVVAALLLRPRGDTSDRSWRAVTTDDRAMLDSLEAADARRDRVTALFWAEQLGARRPRDHGVLRARGTAWMNYALDQRPSRALARPALRTSLERVECMRRALGLMDSSAMAAGAPAQWLDSWEDMARLYETLGLPGEALAAYETIKRRMPAEMRPAWRAYWLRALLYDPVNPDTTVWHRRMQRRQRR